MKTPTRTDPTDILRVVRIGNNQYLEYGDNNLSLTPREVLDLLTWRLHPSRVSTGGALGRKEVKEVYSEYILGFRPDANQMSLLRQACCREYVSYKDNMYYRVLLRNWLVDELVRLELFDAGQFGFVRRPKIKEIF